ncbi:MAG TPA: hypothetical protein VIY27_04780 [Myxococcota bacterium]
MEKTRAVALLILLLGVTGPASAQILAPSRDEVPLTDLLEILLLERELVAVDAESGGQTAVDLHLGERVLWSGARGVVGVVLTDQRMLAVAVDSGSWRETRYQQGERAPEAAMLGDRVALLITSRRALAFNAGGASLAEYRFGPGETLLSSRVGENVGVVVTDRKALGFSPSAGGFFASRLHLRERIGSVETRSNLATVTTNRRVLIFRAPSGAWSERALDLGS